LRLTDLDAERGTLVARQGKGKKDRMVPIGERAIVWLTKYIETVRPDLVGASPTTRRSPSRTTAREDSRL
jgi:integrase/recombinase XerD